MNQLIISLLAFTGGIFLAIQGGLNAQLGIMLKSPFLAALIAFFCSTAFAFIIFCLSFKDLPTWNEVKVIPNYLWFSGGLFSVIGISLYYYTIPKLGVATMISLGLCGQIIFSVIAGHYGWFNLPVEPISLKRLFGVAAMIFGILLINIK